MIIYVLVLMGVELIGLGFFLVGGSLIESMVLNPNEFMIFNIIMALFGLILMIPGIPFILIATKELISLVKGNDKEVAKTINKEEKLEYKDPFREFLISFRKHYSEFFGNIGLKENEKIQWEATQLYRNVLEFRKNRLKRLNITCETIVKNMKLKSLTGISKKKFTDGKYDITEVEEEIAAKTTYKIDGKEIYSKMDKDLACYTIVHTKHIGDDKIICPSCGVESTREELLDGCDYCGTKFMIEDLGDRVAEFALRPDFEIAHAKYKSRRDGILLGLAIAIIAVVFVGWLIYGIILFPEFLSNPDTGIIMTITSLLFAVVITSVICIPLVLVVFWWILPLIAGVIGTLNIVSKSILEKIKVSPEKDKSLAETVQEYDPNFSISNFYTGLQNKISSIIYADTKAQINAFSNMDLSSLLGKYSDVIDIETEYMGINEYTVDDKFQNMEVEVSMKLLEYKGKKCKNRDENWKIKLIKSAACKTQVLCAPSIMTCKSCGISLDLLKGKECSYCGNKLELENYDWVIKEIELFDAK